MTLYFDSGKCEERMSILAYDATIFDGIWSITALLIFWLIIKTAVLSALREHSRDSANKSKITKVPPDKQVRGFPIVMPEDKLRGK